MGRLRLAASTRYPPLRAAGSWPTPSLVGRNFKVRNNVSRVMAQSLLVRLLLAVLLLGNAVSSGVCAMLCSAKACCPVSISHQSCKTSPRPCCPHCKSTGDASGPSFQNTAKAGYDCCAWIGKKIDPPATIIKAIAAKNLQAVAVLPTPVQLPTTEPVLQSRLQIPSDDRAPPGPVISRHQSRAPPTVSM